MKLPWRRRRTDPAAQAQARLQAALSVFMTAPAERPVEALARLVDALRPRRPEDHETARLRLDALTAVLAQDEVARDRLRGVLLGLLGDTHAVTLFADSGVLANESFGDALSRRIAHSLLPEVLSPEHLKDVVSLVFHRPRDYLWVREIPDADWLALLRALAPAPAQHEAAQTAVVKAGTQLLAALEVISYRITAIGLEPELVRNYPAILKHESPFLSQNAETRAYVEDWRAAQAEGRPRVVDGRHIEVLLEQCREIIGKIRRQAARTGASVSLTYLLVRLEQNIARFIELMEILESDRMARLPVLLALFRRLVEAENRRNRVGDLLSQNVELLAQRITGNAGRTGEHYITVTRSEYFALFRSALGAGFIVAFMAMLKIAMGSEPHAPIVTAFLYSMNYGLGFVLIYMLHFTIATKQPAMTAAHIAASLGEGSGRDRLDGLAELIVRTTRSQFIAITGNVLLAFSMPLLLATLLQAYSREPFVSAEEARVLLEEISPLHSPALFHAAIAGVCLFLAGLISGYFDNKAVYNRIPERVAQLRGLKRWLGEARTHRLADYLGRHLGGLTGNFFFGCMLGSMGTLGFILGLPLDIRHVTFSSANFAYALVALEWDIGPRLAVLCALGVTAIGLVNLAVSFALALYVALRAQRVRFREARPLLGKLGRRLLARPQDFFWPPPDVAQAAPR
jgi:site-specific recombinase